MPRCNRSGSSLDAAVALFHSLSDGTRLSIVRRLAEGEARVADLIGELGLAQSTVSAHVACLRDCGLVDGRPEGRQVFYSLARPELMDLLASAETLLAATGNAVACARITAPTPEIAVSDACGCGHDEPRAEGEEEHEIEKWWQVTEIRRPQQRACC